MLQVYVTSVNLIPNTVNKGRKVDKVKLYDKNDEEEKKKTINFLVIKAT